MSDDRPDNVTPLPGADASSLSREERADLAALAMGRLDPQAEPAIMARLDGDAEARDELRDLELAVAALGFADPARLDDTPRPPADLGDRIAGLVVADEVTTRRRARQRRRLGIVGAIAAAAVVVAGLAFALRPDSSQEFEAFTVRPDGVTAEFALAADPVGTVVTFRYQGLDPEKVYWLWLTDESGERIGAGTFRGTADVRTLEFVSALPAEAAVRIWVTTPGADPEGPPDIPLDHDIEV